MKYKCLEKLGITKEKKKSNKVLHFFNKTLTAVLLGLVFLIVMEYIPKFKDYMQNNVLEKNISFAFLDKLYNKYFGKVLPSVDNNIQEVFNEKLVYTDIDKYYDGYKLKVSNNYLVPSLRNGVVVFIGEKDNYGKVIVVESSEGETITYGNIENTSIKLYDYVAKGEFLGEVKSDTLYLIVLKNGEYQEIETYIS